MERPKRAYQFSIEVGADTPEEMAWAIKQIASDIRENINCGTVSGGPSSGWSITLSHTPEKTHDQYIEELKTYLKHREEQQ